jgi:cytochrome c biogenesis factor
MTAILLLVLFFTLLGAAYVKGYDLVKAKSPEHLPQFYLIMATIRMLLVLTVIGLYVWFANNREDAIRFALTCMGLYAVMMVVTLSLRH